ncbi:MAG: hypothetical protein ACI30B_04000 [Paludibacteraceae bacterium]
MALLTCSKCGQLISDKENNCIFCGTNIMYFDKATWDNNKKIFDRLMSDILDRSQRLYKTMLNAGETSISPWLEVFSETGEILSADLFQLANDGFEKSLKDLIEKNIVNTHNVAAAAIISEAWLPDENEKRPLFAKKREGIQITLVSFYFCEIVSYEVIRTNGDFVFKKPQTTYCSTGAPYQRVAATMVFNAINGISVEEDEYAMSYIKSTIKYINDCENKNPDLFYRVFEAPVEKVYSALLLDRVSDAISNGGDLKDHIFGVLTYLLKTGFLEGNGEVLLHYLIATAYLLGIGVPQNLQYALEFLELCVKKQTASDSIYLVRFNDDGELERYSRPISPIVMGAKGLIEYMTKE